MRDVIFEKGDKIPVDSKTGKPKLRQQLPVSNQTLDSINKRYLEDKNFENALRDIKANVIPELKAKEKPSQKLKAIQDARFLEANHELFLNLWESKYEADENENVEESNSTARFEFKRALQLIDPLPLGSIEKKKLKKKWDSLMLNDRQRSRYGVRINELLRQAHRDFQLKLPKRVRNPEIVKHITLDQLVNDLLPKIESEPAKLLAQVLFGSGLRYGEAFAIDNPNKLTKNRTYFVNRQMLDDGRIVDRIKNNKFHNTVLLPELIAAFQEWAAIPIEKKQELRRSSTFERIIPTIARQIFRMKTNKITNHDLRHSYAIHLLSNCGVTIDEVAMLIGDDPQTVRDHYVGYVITDPHVDSINMRIDNSVGKKGA